MTEEEMGRLYAAGHGIAYIARKARRGHPTVRRAIRNCGVSIRTPRDEAKKPNVIALYLAGKRPERISVLADVPMDTIHRWLRRCKQRPPAEAYHREHDPFPQRMAYAADKWEQAGAVTQW